MSPEPRWIVVKDYTRDGDNLTDVWPIEYGTEEEAQRAKTRLEAGQDMSWFDPLGNESAGFEAFLYVERLAT